MGKEGGFMTPKAIANRIKAKGLLKLKFYCQICNKQCRDDNGFKCHINSESHQRQLLIVAESPDKYIDQFSKEFLDNFITLLSRSYGTKRVLANQVYQQYIQDREHLHMNATQWETLSEFVKYLGREGICDVDETPRGWYIAWIDRSPETLAREEALRKKHLADMADQQLQQKLIDEQIERAISNSTMIESEYTELKREDPEEKVKFSITKLPSFKKPEVKIRLGSKKSDADTSADDSTDHKEAPSSSSSSSSSSLEAEPSSIESTNEAESKVPDSQKAMSAPPIAANEASADVNHEANGSAGGVKRKLAAIEDLSPAEEEKLREKKNRKDYWLAKGITVRIISQKLAGGKYFRKKGVVQKVIDFYVGEVRVLDAADSTVDGDIIKLDQEYLETVVPAVGGRILVVNGAYRGERAIVTARNGDDYLASLRIIEGQFADRNVVNIPFEDVCTLA